MSDAASGRQRPLEGRAVLVCRPDAQASGLAHRIREAGGQAVVVPMIEIQPLAPEPAAAAILRQLSEVNLAVFVSGNAVRCGWPLIAAAGGWPARLLAAAVGSGTAAELGKRGVHRVLAPAGGADSEGLLALPALQSISGWQVVIFRGEGGRELLAETLQARGASVQYVECYRRTKPSADPEPLRARVRAGQLHAITATSTEALRNLVEQLGDATPAARSLPLFAMHPRIGEAARALGFTQVIVTDGGDEGLMRGMMMFFSGPAAGG
jgi:uroporphyrinogen-III synthase